MYIFSGMPERHCGLLLRGLPRSPNVMFPSPVHSVTHSPLIAVAGVLMERMVTVAWICPGGIKASVGT